MQSTVTVKGQVTIPKAMREFLGLEPGNKVVFTYLTHGLRIERAGTRRGERAAEGRFAALRGRAGQGPRTGDLMQVLRGYAEDAKDPGFSK